MLSVRLERPAEGAVSGASSWWGDRVGVDNDGDNSDEEETDREDAEGEDAAAEEEEATGNAATGVEVVEAAVGVGVQEDDKELAKVNSPGASSPPSCSLLPPIPSSKDCTGTDGEATREIVAAV